MFICVAVVIYLIPLWGRKDYFASGIQRYFSPSLEERQRGGVDEKSGEHSQLCHSLLPAGPHLLKAIEHSR